MMQQPTCLIAERFIESSHDMDAIEAELKKHEGGLQFVQSLAFSQFRSAAVFVPDKREGSVSNHRFMASLACTNGSKHVQVIRWNMTPMIQWDRKGGENSQGWYLLLATACIIPVVWRMCGRQGS